MKSVTPIACMLALAAASISACSSTPTAPSAQDTTVTNCGREVAFGAEPQRVTLLKPAAVTTLAGLGVLDRVTARAGQYPDDYFDAATRSTLAAIPSLSDKLDTSGHLQISKEEVVASRPDLVLGFTDTVNRQTMADTHIATLEEPAFCGALSGPASWEDVYAEIRLYGTVFHREQRAEEMIAQARARITELEGHAAGAGRSVAVIYPTIGGGVTYAYGTASMSHPLVTSAGLHNVYADNTQRVFEVTAEDLISRNPDVIIALYSSGDAQQVTQAVASMKGMDRVSAVAQHRIIPLLLNFAEPPTPLAVTGLERLDAAL